MKNIRPMKLAALMLLFIFICFFTSGTEASSPRNEEQALTSKADSTSPVNIVLELLEAGLEKGISLRVSFENSGPAGISLNVCPAMLLCCVKGLHPLITCEDTGVGLLDVCKLASATSHETYLPVHSTFSFDINIPPDRLPSACLEKGRQITVSLLYETENAKSINSNAVRAQMN